jgi:hypothetical protein
VTEKSNKELQNCDQMVYVFAEKPDRHPRSQQYLPDFDPCRTGGLFWTCGAGVWQDFDEKAANTLARSNAFAGCLAGYRNWAGSKFLIRAKFVKGMNDMLQPLTLEVFSDYV